MLTYTLLQTFLLGSAIVSLVNAYRFTRGLWARVSLGLAPVSLALLMVSVLIRPSGAGFWTLVALASVNAACILAVSLRPVA